MVNVKFCSNSKGPKCMYKTYILRKKFSEKSSFGRFLRILDTCAVWEYIFSKRSKERPGRTKYLDS